MKFIKAYVATLAILSIVAIVLSIDLGKAMWHLIALSLGILVFINIPTIIDIIRQMRR